MSENSDVSGLQRALWVFLGYMLIGPFFAGLAVSILMVFLPLLEIGAFLPENLPSLGASALSTFVWAAIPSALSALILIFFVLRDGGFGWIVAAVVGVLSFMAATFLTDMPFREHIPMMALLSGLISMAVREALVSGNIIK